MPTSVSRPRGVAVLAMLSLLPLLPGVGALCLWRLWSLWRLIRLGAFRAGLSACIRRCRFARTVRLRRAQHNRLPVGVASTMIEASSWRRRAPRFSLGASSSLVARIACIGASRIGRIGWRCGGSRLHIGGVRCCASARRARLPCDLTAGWRIRRSRLCAGANGACCAARRSVLTGRLSRLLALMGGNVRRITGRCKRRGRIIR